jgi:hypothetical protein
VNAKGNGQARGPQSHPSHLGSITGTTEQGPNCAELSVVVPACNPSTQELRQERHKSQFNQGYTS